MTRSSIVAAVVVTALLAILIWWRGDRAPERATEALSPRAGARAPGEVAAVSSARAVSSTRPVSPAATDRVGEAPAGMKDRPFEAAPDGGAPSSR